MLTCRRQNSTLTPAAVNGSRPRVARRRGPGAGARPSSYANQSAFIPKKMKSIPTISPIAQSAELGSSSAIRIPSTIESSPLNAAAPAPGAPRCASPPASRAKPIATNQITSITVSV